MRALVTGAAGFIGSHLTDSLLDSGEEVIGVDSLTDYYDPKVKRRNLESALSTARFELRTDDLAADPLEPLMEGVDCVFHLAAQPGVRASWGPTFAEYVARNVLATQRLLEAAKHAGIARFVNSSSSSVYGSAPLYPTDEATLPSPVSPYGVTKLAAEHLVTLYGTNYELPTVSLRYFTVYGPRQRPDMAMHRMVEAVLTHGSFPLYGDGQQVRDFTYVDDAVRANLLAAGADVEPGLVCNVGGGAMTVLGDVMRIVEELTGEVLELDRRPRPPGDPNKTGADTTKAHRELGWSPTVTIREGLDRQVAWQRAKKP